MCSGSMRYNIAFSKQTKRWTVKPIHEDKDYTYLDDLVEDVLYQKLHNTDLLDFDTPQSLGLPHNIAPIPPPSKDSLISSHTSRFPVCDV